MSPSAPEGGQLQSVTLHSLTFSENPDYQPEQHPEGLMYGLNVKADGRATDDGSEVDVRLKIDWDDAQPVRPFELEVEVLGSFHWSEPTPDQIREGWTDFNGLYLVWPYLRTYVHTVTALSSLEPLVLPTLAVPKQAAVGTADFEALQAESADH